MKICVYGLWHLGCVTSACLARSGLEIIGLADSREAVASLSLGKAPLFEPDLDDLIREGVGGGLLSFTNEAAEAVGASDLVWVCFDTPVDEEDVADADFVSSRIRDLFPYLRDGMAVLISSQLPVGTTRRLAAEFRSAFPDRRVSFSYSPENLRLGQAIAAFEKPERIVIGVDGGNEKAIIEPVLSRFSRDLLWVGIESAEMTKHALNAYLAASISLSNEFATISEQVGADFREVESALRLDPRIGKRAYVRAGAPFGGGTLARDVNFLNRLAQDRHLSMPLIGHILDSNAGHRLWPIRQLERRLGEIAGRKIAVLGLSYKAGTSSIRRSIGIELCRVLLERDAKVAAFDPKVTKLDSDLEGRVQIAPSATAAAEGAEALIIANDWPEFRELKVADIARVMHRALIVDQAAWLSDRAKREATLEYAAVGVPN